MKKLLTIALISISLTSWASEAPKWTGPLGLEYGLTIKDVRKAIPLSASQHVDEQGNYTDIFTTSSPALEDGAQGYLYEYAFINSQLNQVTAYYRGKNNFAQVENYINKHATCKVCKSCADKTPLEYLETICFKKDRPIISDNIMAFYSIFHDKETEDDTMQVTYLYIK